MMRGNFALSVDYNETGHITLEELDQEGQFYRGGFYGVRGSTIPGQVELLRDYAVNGLDKPGIITKGIIFTKRMLIPRWNRYQPLYWLDRRKELRF